MAPGFGSMISKIIKNKSKCMGANSVYNAYVKYAGYMAPNYKNSIQTDPIKHLFTFMHELAG